MKKQLLWLCGLLLFASSTVSTAQGQVGMIVEKQQSLLTEMKRGLENVNQTITRQAIVSRGSDKNELLQYSNQLTKSLVVTKTVAMTSPPIVLHHQPSKTVRQPVNTVIEISFNQPMNQQKATQAFTLRAEQADGLGPATKGEFNWLDEQTMQFVPAVSLAHEQTYQIKVSRFAVNTAGVKLAEPYITRFQTEAYLQVFHIYPEDETTKVVSKTNISVGFNQPLVSMAEMEAKSNLLVPITFEPPIKGQGQWINRSMYQFTPTDGLQMATTYSAFIPKRLGQHQLKQPYRWSFSTLAPQVVGTTPYNSQQDINPITGIGVAFNMPMNRTQVEHNFDVINVDSEESVAGTITWVRQPITRKQCYGYYYCNDLVRIGLETLVFTSDEPFERGETYRIILSAGLKAANGGDVTSKNEFTSDFTIANLPRIVEVDKDWNYTSHKKRVYFEFNTPMNPDSLRYGKTLVMEPDIGEDKLSINWYSGNRGLYIKFDAEPNSEYTMKLKPGLQGQYGGVLTQRRSFYWKTEALGPNIHVKSPGKVALYNAYKPTEMYIMARNISQLQFSLYRMPHQDFIQASAGNRWYAGEQTESFWENYTLQSQQLVATWTLPITPELNHNYAYRIDLNEQSGLGKANESLPPGIYYFEVTAPDHHIYPEARPNKDHYSLTAKKLLVVSPYNVTLKRSANQILAWVTDLQTGQTITNVPVTFNYNQGNNPAYHLGRIKTDEQGVALLERVKALPGHTFRSPNYYALVGSAESGDHFGIVSSEWDDGITRYGFDDVKQGRVKEGYVGHIYTERELYRPGQTVYFKGIFRHDNDAIFTLLDPETPVEISVHDSRNKRIFSDTVSLSQMGTAHSYVILDEEAPLGSYEIKMSYNQELLTSKSFRVTEYKKPEFQVTVSSEKSDYAQGDTISMTAQATFFFGGPVSQAKVRWSLLADEYRFRYSGKPRYDFTDSEGYSYRRYGGTRIASGNSQTDDQGRFEFVTEADIKDKLASQQYILEVEVEDINNQMVAGRGRVIVHQSEAYVGLRPKRYIGKTGQASEVEVVVVDWQNQPISNQSVQVIFARRDWYSVQKQNPDGSYYWDSVLDDIPTYTTTATTDAFGKARAIFTPTLGGRHKVIATVTDSKLNTARASTYMWVSSYYYINWKQENSRRLELVADQESYQVGDTAKILVPHPFSETVQALVTFERGRIYHQYVQTLETNSDLLEIPITSDLGPNMYISVVVVKGETPQANGTEAFPEILLGYTNLKISNNTQHLNIEITPNEPPADYFQPADIAAYKIRVTDFENNPVQAELSVALVDKAILSLQPEAKGQMITKFWKERGLAVETAGSLIKAMDRINYKVVKAKGGGGGMEIDFDDARKNFKETALWEADLVTDERGEVVIAAILPDNLTTWTLNVKAVTGADTRVGETSYDIISTKPLLVRPVTPRFFVKGDTARLGMIVQNNTKQEQVVNTRFEATGLTLEPVNPDPSLTVDAGQRVRLDYWVTVSDTDHITLSMGARSAQYQDALTFGLPVHSYQFSSLIASGAVGADGLETELITLPPQVDSAKTTLNLQLDSSLAGGLQDGLAYLEHFPHECIEQTLSRFLPNLYTYRAYEELNIKDIALTNKLPDLVNVGLQRVYNHQQIDGGWGWWLRESSNPMLSAYILLGLVEAKKAGFTPDEKIMYQAISFLKKQYHPIKDNTSRKIANQQALVLYALTTANQGDLGRAKVLYKHRQKLDLYSKAFLALAIHEMDKDSYHITRLLKEITDEAITAGSQSYWQENHPDYRSMNTDLRTTAIIVAALSRIQPEHGLLPQAVRWLMNNRSYAGRWATTQETAWSLIGLTDWLVASGELDSSYAWRVLLNDEAVGRGTVTHDNLLEDTTLHLSGLEEVNRLQIEKNAPQASIDPYPLTANNSGRLYYAAYLNQTLPLEEVGAVNEGITIYRQYLRPTETESHSRVGTAKLGESLKVKLTIIVPEDLHYVLIEDPIPAGTDIIDTSLAIYSVSEYEARLKRLDYRWGWWRYISYTEFRDDRVVLYAEYLPAGTYEYTYNIHASVPGTYNVRPAYAEQMYAPDIYGRSEGSLFVIGE